MAIVMLEAVSKDAPIKSVSIGSVETDTTPQSLTPDGNGNVNIPLCGTHTFGVCRLGKYTNLKLISRFSDYNVLGIDTVSSQQIADRLPYYAVPLNKLNDCVIAALSDGQKIQMTDAQRLSALLALGCTVDENGYVKWTAQSL